ncbi:hypothetical protein [Streptomyces sp. NPDC020298]|uniref:hypothetical protein n=1 Tax=unclassified Streptomyces TaxID=2593676 RepID=UPI0033C2220F
MWIENSGIPKDPILLFEEDGGMCIIHDLALVNELIEDASDFYEAFDALARPVKPVGQPGEVTFVLKSEEPDESTLRRRVDRYYRVWAARHSSGIPPQVEDVQAFVLAVANDEVTE